jgi:uroporphyrinogen III methyltransferase/synthase
MSGAVGHITLVGAGPGDPGLITVKGLAALREADVIVYDKLANPRLLAHARPGAELIDVGKTAGTHPVPQDEITQLLVRKAQDGRRVARLKGGDPFIFGRGQEELDAALAAGVAFSVVPGVTAAAGASAYAGLPLTVRAVSTSVTLVTGHEDPDKPESQVDWKALAKAGGTLVVYMGIGRLMHITSALMEGGMSPDMPAAVVRKATLPEQKTVSATLSKITDVVEEEGIKPPALLIVGEIARPDKQLAWFERLPLFGTRIVVTRSRAQASTLVSALEERGAGVLELPTIRITAPQDAAPLDEAIRGLGRYDYAIFTSTNTVDVFRARMRDLGLDARAFATVRVASIGQATAERLLELGLRADVVGMPFTAEGLLDALAPEEMSGRRVLLPRAQEARDVLPEGLRSRGATVDVVEAYRTVLPDDTDAECARVFDAIDRGEVDFITFTSSSTVSNLVQLAGERRIAAARFVPAAVIGPITAATARDAGFSIAVASLAHTIPALAEAIVAFAKDSPRPRAAVREATAP